MDLSEVIKSVETKCNLDLSVFREPRGVCRVLQLVVGVLAGIAIYGFEGTETIQYCKGDIKTVKLSYSYPFQLTHVYQTVNCNGNSTMIQLAVIDDFSQYAEFFLMICILSILYSIVSMVVYSKCTASYETNDKYPLVDFIGNVIIAVLWLFGSAAWTHGLSGLKAVTDPVYLVNTLNSRANQIIVRVTNSGYFGLNVSAVLGCLSFFLWAADLWFLYKETPWFQGRRGQAVDSPA